MISPLCVWGSFIRQADPEGKLCKPERPPPQIHLGSISDPSRIHFGSTLDASQIHLGSTPGPPWIHLGSRYSPHWSHLGPTSDPSACQQPPSDGRHERESGQPWAWGARSCSGHNPRALVLENRIAGRQCCGSAFPRVPCSHVSRQIRDVFRNTVQRRRRRSRRRRRRRGRGRATVWSFVFRILPSFFSLLLRAAALSFIFRVLPSFFSLLLRAYALSLACRCCWKEPWTHVLFRVSGLHYEYLQCTTQCTT